MSQENYTNKFKVGSFYSRNAAWNIFHPGKGDRPKGGVWDTGYAREGINLLIFMNIGIPGSTGHDFSNKYDEDKEIITWYGKPDSHSGQKTFKKLLNGELIPLFFARWDNKPNFKYLGTGEILNFKDHVDIPNDTRKTIQLTIKCENLNHSLVDKDKSDEESFEKEIHIRKNAAITGNKAEGLFKESAKEKLGLTIIKDLTDEYGYGYDFLCQDENKKECYVEIKGCKESIGSIRMTQNEWNVAREKNDQYLLVIVSHIYNNPEFKKYVNPFRLFEKQIEMKEITSVTMHINKEDLI